MPDLKYNSSSYGLKYQKFMEKLFSNNHSSGAKYKSQTVQKPLRAFIIDDLFFLMLFFKKVLSTNNFTEQDLKQPASSKLYFNVIKNIFSEMLNFIINENSNLCV